jgi:DNA-binding phage protein
MGQTTRAGALFETDVARELADPNARAFFERELSKANAIATLMRTLDEARKRNDISKAEVARRVGSERSSISRLLSGREANPTLNTLADVADALDVEIEVRLKPRPAKSRKPHTPVKVVAPRFATPQAA